MVRSLLITFAMLLSVGVAVAQTILQGTVRDDKEPLIGASVKITKGAETIRGGITDTEGNYRIQLDPGTYNVEVSYTGYQVQRTEGVQVLSNKLNTLDFTLADGLALDVVEIKAFKVPLINKDGTESGGTLTSAQIEKMPTRNVQQIVATTAGVTTNEAGDVNIKGGRKDGTNYYIDGIRVSSNNVPPVQDLEQIQVITGGLGSEYGDVTGGVISIITKGPASEYHGGLEVENSYGLDQFGYLLGSANVSGPILKKKLPNGGSRTIVGFRMSGQYLGQKDGDPPALPIYKAKESVLANLSAHPLLPNGGTGSNAAENLTRDSVDVFKYRPNNKRRDIDLTGKLDFRLTDAIDVSVTGTFKDIEDEFTPTGASDNSTWALLNSQNNPTNYQRRYRGLARFRHRLGNADPDKNASSSKVSISNASYQIQFGFERGLEHRADKTHGDNYFDYGYIGKFDFTDTPVADQLPDRTVVHTGYRRDFVGYTQGSQNPGLAAYNEFANSENYNSYNAKNGLFSSQYDNVWSDLHVNINQGYNRNSKEEKDVVTLMASSSFDLKLGKSGVHNIQFGLINEQRTDRSWILRPFSLWNLMNQSQNIQFNGLDTTRIIGRFWDPILSPEIGDSIDQYANSVIPADRLKDNRFYREARKINGVGIDQFLNVNSINPDQFRLDMFSARELIEQDLVQYYGYDYLGNKVAATTTFNDFFTKRDAEDVRTFPVAPLQPLYQAAYIKDKFQFNKMIFSIGLRVERFDLNTKVLKDEYSLYPINTAKDFFAIHSGNRPGTIGDDFKVYTVSDQDDTPFAFRDGDTWYDADGIQANDGNQLYGQKVVYPSLQDTIAGDDIFDTRFNPDLAFEDYTPQVNWLPRLAFSFPISEDANFFAHYDVLVQRPTEGWQVTALDYAYFNTPSRTNTSATKNNANLRPERVVDYEVGFQQRLNQNSALKFSAYYREMRDMIQRRTLNQVYRLTTYDTYGNVDFGTVKGFTLQYDLRRIQNAEFRLAYTLQFADGTGSDANANRGLTRRGTIRNLFPLTFDERHNITAILDYRFDEGKRYNGPRIGNSDILSNFGINFQTQAVSGRPYTSKLQAARFGGNGTVGSINGNRLPWRFNIDMRIDKSFNLAAAGKKELNVNVYLRVSNLLNRKNVVKVYPVTGSPTDDGFLAGGDGKNVLQGYIAEGRNLQGFLDSYSYVLLDPDNYSQPRRIFVGAIFGF